MRIAFLGDISHPNAQSWIAALKTATPCTIVTWSLPDGGGPARKIFRVCAWIKAVFRIRSVVLAVEPDLVIAYRTTSYGFLGAVSGFHPLVVAAQGETDVWPATSWFVGVKRWMARFCLKNADLIHAWGDHIADEQIALGASRDKILIRPRGVDLKKFYRHAREPARDRLRLVCTRSLFLEYRHTVILNALAGLTRAGVPFSFDIVGTGTLSDDLQRQAMQLGIADWVRFHGRVDHDRLPSLLRDCHVYVAMPITEGVSASLLEAMACGCYPVVTDLVANRYWITSGQNGTLVSVDDARGLENALLALWNNPGMIADATAQNVRLVREKASLEENMACFVRSYERLAGNGCARH